MTLYKKVYFEDSFRQTQYHLLSAISFLMKSSYHVKVSNENKEEIDDEFESEIKSFTD